MTAKGHELSPGLDDCEGFDRGGVLLWLKATELAVQLRPRSLRRLAALPDLDARAVIRWYYGVDKRVWPHEVWNFLFREKRRRDGPTLNEFWGPPLDAEEAAMRRVMASPNVGNWP
jgi:anaerobic magnesium-protoporphyrin IX monomethyl ester cyclase